MFSDPPGFEQCTGIPCIDLYCENCHVEVEAPGSGCTQCHESPIGGDRPLADQCFVRHGRQKTDGMLYDDVHRSAGMSCGDCHSSREAHGDGISFNSLLQDGATETRCENCHPVGSLPANAEHEMHLGDIDCTACHSESMISCVNCHFQSEIDYGVKLAYEPRKDWTFLMNYRNKVHSATIMTLEYQGNTFVAAAPYSAHIVSAAGKHCVYCHNSQAVGEYDQTGAIAALFGGMRLAICS